MNDLFEKLPEPNSENIKVAAVTIAAIKCPQHIVR